MKCLACTVLLCLPLLGCSSTDDRDGGGQGVDVVAVNVPNNVFTLFDEAIAFRATGRPGEDMRDSFLPLDALRKRIEGDIDDVYLYKHGKQGLEPIDFQWKGPDLVANLIGGQTYVVFRVPTGRLLDHYKILCWLEALKPRLTEKRLLDPICLVILCTPELFEAQELFDQFDVLAPFAGEFETDGVMLGGWGEPMPPFPPGGGDICEKCTQFGGVGNLHPIPECRGHVPPRSLSATVVNMIPQWLSDETNGDSEPFLSVDRRDSDCMAGSAFTPSPTGGQAPIFVTSDSGNNWTLNEIVPSIPGTGDITMAPGNSLKELYAGILRRPDPLNQLFGDFLHTPEFKGTALMDVIGGRTDLDQPYVQTKADGATDRVYIGSNDLAVTDTRSATIDFSGDSGVTFQTIVLETRDALPGQDGPSIRPAIADDGTAYAAFFGWRDFTSVACAVCWSPAYDFTSDVVVVRDDPGGTTDFGDLKDPSDGKAGRLVATDRVIPWRNGPFLGQERIGSTLTLAVHPANSSIVYIGWCDRVGTDDYTLHVRSSDDSGQTWSTDDVRTITDATCVTLAAAPDGTVGLLYHQLESADSGERWKVRIDISNDGFTSHRTLTLADTPADTPIANSLPYLGDYNYLTVTGNEFRGVFSACNTPDLANFPESVRYQRKADFTSKQLLDDAGQPVNVSIDPFYFSVTGWDDHE